jgi:hypothetical protein
MLQIPRSAAIWRRFWRDMPMPRAAGAWVSQPSADRPLLPDAVLLNGGVFHGAALS